jgi:hypothetical protein
MMTTPPKRKRPPMPETVNQILDKVRNDPGFMQ